MDKYTFARWFTPEQSGIATAAGFGSFVALILTKPGWKQMLVLFFVGQITAFYFTLPVAMWLGWSMSMYGPLGFLIGMIGMLFWGAVIKLAELVTSDPIGTAERLWALWKGRGG